MENKYFKLGIIAIISVVLFIVAYALYINISSDAHVKKMTQAQYAAVVGSKINYRGIHPSLLKRSISLEAEWMEDIQSQLEGKITKVFVKEGSHVKAGDIIAQVENIDLPAQIAQVDALISQAQAKVASAAQDVERYRILASQGAASQKQYDDSQTALAVAQGELASTQAQRQQLIIKQAKDLIVAPRDGDILNLYCRQGYYIRVGESICLIGDFTKLMFELTIENKLAQNFRGINDFYLPLSLDSVKNKAYRTQNLEKQGHDSLVKAKLLAVYPPFSQESALRTLRWQITDNIASVEPTTYENVDIIAETTKVVLAVPLSALIYDDMLHSSEATVFVIDEDNKLSKRAVELGGRDQKYAEIIAGLQQDEIVLISGKQGLQAGQTVQVNLAGRNTL